MSLGERRKLATSRRRNSKRRRSSTPSGSNKNTYTNGGGTKSKNSSNKRRGKTNTEARTAGGSGSSLGTNDPQRGVGEVLRDPPDEDDDWPRAREGAPSPGGQEGGGGTSLDPDAPLAPRAAMEFDGVHNDDAAVVETAASSVSDGTSNSGGGGSDVVIGAGAEDGGGGRGSGGGDGGGEDVGVDGNNDPFALLAPDTLSSFDIVLTTFEVLRAEVHHAESKFVGASGEAAAAAAVGGGATSRPSLRQKKRWVDGVLTNFLTVPRTSRRRVTRACSTGPASEERCCKHLVRCEREGLALLCLALP